MANRPKSEAPLDEISLFPLPGNVPFPLAKIQLHIFEPRYRKMIHDSIANHRRIGVAHVKKILAPSRVKPTAPIEEKLNSNQGSYLPHEVFSAGFAKLQETLPDGRLLVEIEMDSRFQSIDEVQSVPYKIMHCQRYEDTSVTDAENLRQELNQLLITTLGPSFPEIENILSASDWLQQSSTDYSFRIYSLIGFDPDLMQTILEMRSASDRISYLKDCLQKGPLH